MDDTVTSSIAEKIFIELIEFFPTKLNKKDFGQMLLSACLKAIKNNKSEFILRPATQVIREKIDKLSQATNIFNSGTKLWTPKVE